MSKPDALALAAQLESAWAADDSPDLMMEAAAELRRLHAENEELRKDAERYRWLVTQPYETWKRIGFRFISSPAAVDAAIDAAMKEANHE